jgi:hypothetical protein
MKGHALTYGHGTEQQDGTSPFLQCFLRYLAGMGSAQSIHGKILQEILLF